VNGGFSFIRTSHNALDSVGAIISFSFLLTELAVSPPFLRKPPNIELASFFLSMLSGKMPRVTYSGESSKDLVGCLGVNLSKDSFIGLGHSEGGVVEPR